MRRWSPADIPPSPDVRHEQPLWAQGLTVVGGVDEAGRGCWAGPVTAAVVVLPPTLTPADLGGVRDSKQMQPRARAEWAQQIHQLAAAWAVGFAGQDEIDQLGIVAATCLAIRRALAGLPTAPQHLLVDYLHVTGVTIPQTPLVKGDARSLSIAAASVLAKTARDQRLTELDEQYPGYGFAVHKGYGTAQHQAALAHLGPCAIHRRSFAPIRALLPAQPAG